MKSFLQQIIIHVQLYSTDTKNLILPTNKSQKAVTVKALVRRIESLFKFPNQTNFFAGNRL